MTSPCTELFTTYCGCCIIYTSQQRIPTGVPGAIYRKAALQPKLEQDSARFDGYPCVGRKLYTPACLDKSVFKERSQYRNQKGQEAIVLGTSEFFRDAKEIALDLYQHLYPSTWTWD